MLKNLHQKLVPDPFLVLVNNPKQQVHAKNCFKKDIVKEDYQTSLKKLSPEKFLD